MVGGGLGVCGVGVGAVVMLTMLGGCVVCVLVFVVVVMLMALVLVLTVVKLLSLVLVVLPSANPTCEAFFS